MFGRAREAGAERLPHPRRAVQNDDLGGHLDACVVVRTDDGLECGVACPQHDRLLRQAPPQQRQVDRAGPQLADEHLRRRVVEHEIQCTEHPSGKLPGGREVGSVCDAHDGLRADRGVGRLHHDGVLVDGGVRDEHPPAVVCAQQRLAQVDLADRPAGAVDVDLVPGEERRAEQQQDAGEQVLQDVPEREAQAMLKMPRLPSTSTGLIVGKTTVTAAQRVAHGVQHKSPFRRRAVRRAPCRAHDHDGWVTIGA